VAVAVDHLRRQILALAEEYTALNHSQQQFVPGVTAVPVAGKVLGATEMRLLVDSALDFWLTTGRFNAAFEKKLARYLDVRSLLTSNSGSSANLLACSALTSAKLGDQRLKPGDEVITVASGFPTTINPAFQNGLVPVFVDIDIPTYNVNVEQLEAAIGPKTRAIVLAHTLGNPFDLHKVTELANRHGLWLIEDCCDALGSTFEGKKVGTFGHIGTLSFYPAHHITMGEGGAVFTNDPKLKVLIESFRDWGRDCWCEPGKDNTCGKRFCWQVGQLPAGYDHKYIYSHIGYNLKITDMQAAVGLAQLDRLDDFVQARKKNFAYLKGHLQDLAEFLILPEATANSDPSWFGFPITVRTTAPFNRLQLTTYLESKRIGTRLLFGGNLTRQPAYEGRDFRIAAELVNSDMVMNCTFWIGVFPGLNEDMLNYMIEQMYAFVAPFRAGISA
jgi:CDP-6-deoxy-D-xylo-4-hexulose-3-dehydrase